MISLAASPCSMPGYSSVDAVVPGKKPPLGRFPGQRGFTIVEVLVAVVFFIFGVLALYRLQVGVIQTNTQAALLSRATAAAEARMESLLALDYEGLLSSTSPQTDGPFSVTWAVTPDTPIPEAKTVQVTVAWTDSKNEPHGLILQSIKGK